MGVRVTIGGEEMASKIDWAKGPIIYADEMNVRPSASFWLVPNTYVDKYAPVVIYENDETTPAWRGFVLRRPTEGSIPRAPTSRQRVECVGRIAFVDKAYITKTYSSATAAQTIIGDLVDVLSDYGHTVSYTPVSYGVSLGPLKWERKRVSDALREVADACGRIATILPTDELVLIEPGADSAPIDIPNTGKVYDFAWDDDGEIPPNAIKLVCGTGQEVASFSFETDGTAEEYEVGYPVSQDINDVFPNQLIVDGSVVAVVGWGPDQLPAGHWYWDYENGKLVNGTGTPYPSGHTITGKFTKQFPFEVSDDTGDTPVVEEVIARPDITTKEQATAALAALLAQAGGDTLVAEIHTREPGCAIGQSVPVDTAMRGDIDTTFIITGVRAEIRSEQVRHYYVNVTSAAGYRRNFLDHWRDVTSGGGASTSTLALVTGGGSGGSAGGGSGGSVPWAYLGGSRNTSEEIGSAGAYEAVPQHVDYVAPASYTGRVRVQLRAGAPGETVTARLRNVTDGTTAGTSSGVTGTTMTEVSFVVAITKGKRYRLQVTSDANGGRAYGIGSLEAA